MMKMTNLCILFVLFGSLSSPTLQAQENSKMKDPIIFIHGIKGSQLQDNISKDVYWLTTLEALGLSSMPLALPLKIENGVQAKDNLVPGPILDYITIIPLFLKQPIYGPWLESLRRFGSPVEEFSYDWRRDNLETLERLNHFIDEVRLKNGNRKVHVVSHSMGGLLAMAALNSDPSRFNSVTFAGVPFAGGIGFLPDLEEGTQNGLNGRILNPQILATFISIYSFFPLDGHGLIDKDGQNIAMDFYNPEFWRKEKFTLVQDKELYHFLEWALPRAKEFRQKVLTYQPVSKYPSLLIVRGTDFPTLVEAQRSKDGRWNFKSRQKIPGDERVAAKDAVFPGAETPAYEMFETHFDHAGLLNDPLVINRIRQFIQSRE